MSTDLTIGIAHRPGTLGAACEALGHAGVNIEAASGHVVDGQPVLHVLVEDAERASRALIDAGFDILGRRQVLARPIENRPGAAAEMLRQATAAGVSIDLIYTTLDGRVVLGADDLAALRAALGG